jgi:hypothetical protein
MLNREAVDQTIGAMESDGKLRPEHAALVTMVQGLASSVDDEPHNASLWREFRAALETLRQIGLEGQEDEDEISVIIAALRGAAPVRNAEDPKPVKPRPRGGKAGGAAG